MSNIITRTYEPRDERAMNEVIQQSFKNPNANAYPLPPSRFVVIAELDGKVVGHTSIRPMLFHVGGSIVRAGILHMVGTDPAHQHEGIGHAMLDKVTEIMRAERLAISLLETPVPLFYRLKNWEVVSDRVDVTVPRAAVEAGAAKFKGTLELRDGSLDRLAVYAGTRERMGSKCWFFVHTNGEYMKLLADKMFHGSLVEFFYEIWLGGQYKGYLFGSRDISIKEGEALRITIKELAMDAYDPATIAAIYKELLSFDDEFQAVGAGFNVVPGLAVAMKALGGTDVKVGGNVDMIRINMVREFFKAIRGQLEPALAGFLRKAKQKEAQDVLLDVDGERVVLSCKGGHVVVNDGTSSCDGCATFSLARTDLARVVTGLVAPSVLVTEGKARCEPRVTLAQLDAVFPPRPVVINYSNHFFTAHAGEMGIEN
ncbi:MAG: GNAT family N-acetyltransferase [Candidatus Lokiarchaeota archaeon]|nr:GNAT family N-acetyltransferase [Candidatus Lokiarchaeota archaeon]